MITRFDHVVIGVQKLEEALESYTKLGFEVFEGGRHPSLGTRNAIIRFGLDYIELLEIEHTHNSRSLCKVALTETMYSMSIKQI